MNYIEDVSPHIVLVSNMGLKALQRNKIRIDFKIVFVLCIPVCPIKLFLIKFLVIASTFSGNSKQNLVNLH